MPIVCTTQLSDHVPFFLFHLGPSYHTHSEFRAVKSCHRVAWPDIEYYGLHMV
jgi:hypothetical protein